MDTLVIDDWLSDVLGADPTIQAQVDDRIFAEKAPKGTAFPFIVFAMQADLDVTGVGAVRIWTQADYLIRVIKPASSYADLMVAADAIDEALHAKAGVTTLVAGRVESCVRLSEFRMVEDDGDTEIRHAGGTYRISAREG